MQLVHGYCAVLDNALAIRASVFVNYFALISLLILLF